jgi:hypothetical protein
VRRQDSTVNSTSQETGGGQQNRDGKREAFGGAAEAARHGRLDGLDDESTTQAGYPATIVAISRGTNAMTHRVTNADQHLENTL